MENSPSNSTSAASPAINVGFSSSGHRHGESSSQAESRSSDRISGKRSRESPTPDEGHVTAQDKANQFEHGSSSTGSGGHRTRKSGGFLLDSVLANGSSRAGPDIHGKRKAQDGQLRVDKRRVGASRLSANSSLRGSPLSREVSVDGPTDGRDGPSSRPSSMDATQLVQMALNLSESRKRHVSNTLRVPSGTERPVTPALMSNIGTVRASSSTRKRSGQYIDDVSRGSPSSDRTGDGSTDQPVSSPGSGMDNVFYTFSPATLARAEKARKYFELASEHRRLLQSLPPLKPDPSAPLGRSYNPIQSLRNRRIRIREKRPFPAPPETWQDVEKVSSWIGDVESTAQYSDNDAADDNLQLPLFTGEDEAAKGEPRLQQSTTRHRRAETTASVITRPENSWTIEPTELLADAYWTEHGDNKAFIETRKGYPVFPARERHSVTTPRISVEKPRGKNDEFESNDVGEDFEEAGRPSRRRKLLLPLTGTEGRKHRRLISRASSSSSGSSKERRPSGMLLTSGSDENIGPLERHMQELIAKYEKGELSSPEMSPDHWNSKAKPMPAQRGRIDRSLRGSFSRPDGRGSLEVPRDIGHRRSKSADGRFRSVDHSISSAEDNMSSEPASPQVSRNIPSMGMDLSLPSDNRRSSEGNRPRGPTLPSFRSHSKERHKIGQTDFAESTPNSLSPIPSAGSYRPQTPLYDPRPDDFRRHRTNDSWTSLRRVDTGGTIGSSKESGSTVSRFLRNRRDRIFKNRDKIDGGGDLSAGVSDVSEADDSPKVDGQLKRKNTNDSEGSTRGSLEGERPKPKSHHSNLPSFTSSRDRRIETPGLLKDDPIGGPLRRPEKFDGLAPPIINLPQASTSDPELAADSADALSGSRKSYGQLHPLFGELPRRSLWTGAPTPGISQSKRHWSIYDKASAEQNDKITTRDIARVRALLLSSGIKAREISRRADHARDPPPALLTKAAATAGQTLGVVQLKEEHLVAARMLADHLSSSLSGFEDTLSQFRSGPARHLGSQLEDLRQRASDHLSKLVHDTSDEADAFTIELNTKAPQQTKRVDDAVDKMLRRRRRQLRLLRIAGFKVLEWLVLGILWWIWFLVAMFNTVRKIVLAIWRFLHWLFVF